MIVHVIILGKIVGAVQCSDGNVQALLDRVDRIISGVKLNTNNLLSISNI